jgi:hypothetical protein
MGVFMWWLVFAKPRQGASPSPRCLRQKARAELGEGGLGEGSSEDWRSRATSLGEKMHIIADYNTGEFLKQCCGLMPTKNTNRSERFAVEELLRFEMRLRQAKGGHFSAPPSLFQTSKVTGDRLLSSGSAVIRRTAPAWTPAGGGILLQPQKPWFRDSRVAGKPFAGPESRFHNCFMSRPGGHKHHFQGRLIPTLQCRSLFQSQLGNTSSLKS